MELFTPKQLKVREQSNLVLLQEQEERASQALLNKMKLNSQLEETHTHLMEERNRELGEIELRIRTVLHTERKEIEELESRRRQALTPVLEEIHLLEKKREEEAEQLHKLTEERQLVKLDRQKVREEETRLDVLLHEMQKTREETIIILARQKRDSEEVIQMSKIAIQALQEEQGRHQALSLEWQKKEESAKKAEMTARAAILAADNRILKERREQERTDEKRQMLGLAIKELKRRGLWARAQKIMN